MVVIDYRWWCIDHGGDILNYRWWCIDHGGDILDVQLVVYRSWW